MNISILDNFIGPLSDEHLSWEKHMLGTHCSAGGSRKRPGLEMEVGKPVVWSKCTRESHDKGRKCRMRKERAGLEQAQPGYEEELVLLRELSGWSGRGEGQACSNRLQEDGSLLGHLLLLPAPSSGTLSSPSMGPQSFLSLPSHSGTFRGGSPSLAWLLDIAVSWILSWPSFFTLSLCFSQVTPSKPVVFT